MKIFPPILRALAWLHCGLVAAVLFCALFSCVQMAAPTSFLSPAAAFWRGILFALPAGLCYHAVKRLPHLWQFLLASLLLCGLSWLLAGQPLGAGLMALMCLFRLRARLAEEDEGPQASLFDQPAYPFLGLFAAAYLLSALLDLIVLQKLSLLGSVLYLLLCLGHHGLDRIYRYLLLNKDMHGLPARRIQRIAGAATLACVLAAAFLLLPPALLDTGSLHIQLPETTGTYAPPQIEIASSDPLSMDLSQLIGGPTWQIPPFFSYLLMGIAVLLLAVALLAALRGLFLNFRRSYTDSRDLVQYLSKEDQDELETAPGAGRRPRLWDRSPNATVRRRYRQAILKRDPEPASWHTPAQLEQKAGVSAPKLHALYEQARYSPTPVTQADLKELKELKEIKR